MLIVDNKKTLLMCRMYSKLAIEKDGTTALKSIYVFLINFGFSAH